MEYRVSKDSEYETTYCVKPTPELTVTTSFYSSKKKVTPAELSGITDQAWTAAKSS